MNAIEYALAEYLQDPVLGHIELAVQHSALPLYGGWSGTVFLTTGGDFLFCDAESDPGELRLERDPQSQLMSLVVATKRHPILSNLLPPRSTESENCEACNGTGATPFGNGRVLCRECHGVGWSGKLDRSNWLVDTSALPYPPFDEAVGRLKILAAREGGEGDLLFLSSRDATFRRGTLYIAVPAQRVAFERARREYNLSARRRLGVLLATVGRLENGRGVAHVSGPLTAEQAISEMYPDGLKLSVLTSPRAVREVGRIRLAVLRAVAAVQSHDIAAADGLR